MCVLDAFHPHKLGSVEFYVNVLKAYVYFKSITKSQFKRSSKLSYFAHYLRTTTKTTEKKPVVHILRTLLPFTWKFAKALKVSISYHVRVQMARKFGVYHE